MNTTIRRLLPALCLLLLGLALPLLATAQAQGPNRAAVVVRYEDGRVASRCVSFAEESISGRDLLERAGFSLIAQGSGAGTFVCKIDDVGCNYPEESCHCRCMGGDCVYWTYFHLIDEAWHYSSIGAGSYQVRSGAVEGWAWGPGREGSGTAPPVIPFGQICPALAPEPTEEPPTWTMPRPSSTSKPTARPAAPSATTEPAPEASATEEPAPPSTTPEASATEEPAPPSAAPEASATRQPATATAQVEAAAPAPTASPRPSTTTAPTSTGGVLRYVGFAGVMLALLAAGLVLARRRART